MAKMQNLNSGESIILRPHHVFGRAKAKADTCIDDSNISRVHASVRWKETCWELIDHSRNGTWLNGVRLIHNVNLCVGDKVSFKGDGTQIWMLSDVTAPINMLVSLSDKAEDIALDSMHMLANEEDPELILFLSEQGRWIIAESGIEKNLSDGDIVTLGSELRWRFQMALPASETLNAEQNNENAIEKYTFEFRVSEDEEHTCLNVNFENARIEMGERVHHYLLLLLARIKYVDYQNGFAEDSTGWVEISELQKMLGLDYCHLNIQIYRARQQIKKLLSMDANAVLERRFGSIRFAGKKFQIVRAGEMECDCQADCYA